MFCHINVSTEKQQGDPTALLSYTLLSIMLLWRFYIAGNNRIYIGLHLNCLMFSFDSIHLDFWAQIFVRFPIWNFTGIRSAGTELIHADRTADGRTHKHDEANRRFLRLNVRTLKVWYHRVYFSAQTIFFTVGCSYVKWCHVLKVWHIY